MNYILFTKAFQDKYRDVNDKLLLFQYLREELQYLILFLIYSRTYYPVYFMGGTKLRLSYGINRFSEDIDFALEEPDLKFPSEYFLKDILSGFSEKITGFKVNGGVNISRNVVKIMLSFSKILFDLGLSPLPSQTIKIKIEIDTNPPKFAVYEKKTYRSLGGDYIIHTHDLETGFSGKIAAVLFREYQKGRDYYDLQWYLQHRPKIGMNFDYLNANIVQQNNKRFKNRNGVIDELIKKIKKTDLDLMRKDLERFLTMDKKTFDEWLTNYIPETLDLLKTYKNTK